MAVKRMLRTFHTLALQECTILVASDEHPNVVRYYAMEVRGTERLG